MGYDELSLTMNHKMSMEDKNDEGVHHLEMKVYITSKLV